jgi:hypothetical protein
LAGKKGKGEGRVRELQRSEIFIAKGALPYPVPLFRAEMLRQKKKSGGKGSASTTFSDRQQFGSSRGAKYL